MFGIGLVLTSGALALVHRTTTPDRWMEVLTVVAANLAATAVRFLLFRLWVFRGAGTNKTTHATTSTETGAP